MAVAGEAELEQEQKLGPAADDGGVFAVSPKELACLVARCRTVQLERRQRHLSGRVASSAPKKRRRPFLLRTRSSAPPGRPLTRTRVISTSGWWNGTSVPKSTRVGPTR